MSHKRGVQEDQGSKTIYLQCASGKLVQRVKEPTAKSKARKLTKGPNEGKEVHEIFHGSVIGLIEKITLESSDYGKQWAIVLDTTQVGEEPEKTILKIGVDHSYARGVIWALPNIDLNDDVMIKPYEFIPKGEDKMRTGNTVYQWSEKEDKWTKVAQAYSRDNPNGLPELVKVKFRGKDTFDDTDRAEFLEKMVLSFFPEGEKVDPFQNSVEQFEEEGQPQAAEEPHDPTDDLPF